MWGEIAAGTLGFIHGNTRGAYKAIGAYKSYQKLRKRKTMTNGHPTPPNTGKRKRRSSVVTHSGSGRRKLSYSAATGKRKSSKKSKSKKSKSTNERQPEVRTTSGKVKLKGHKAVKVSKSLSEKIGKIIEGKDIHGYYQDTRLDILEPGLLAGQQNVELLPNRTYAEAGFLFPWSRVLHAASRLWNAKTGNVNNPQPTDAGNFPSGDTVVTVNKQWWTFRLRNNSSRTAEIRVYKCQPKNSVVQASALEAWTQGITQMIADGEAIGSVPVLSVNYLHTGPTLSNQFRNAFKADTIQIKLEPGQQYTFNVNGPAMKYEGQKFYDAAVYRPVQKQDIQLIWSSNVDLVGSHDTITGLNPYWGRVPDAFAGSPTMERIIVESTYHVAMCMPEKTLGTISVGQNYATSRERKLCIDDITPKAFGVPATSFIHRRDEENPQAEMVTT